MTPKRAVHPLPLPSPHCRPCASMKTGAFTGDGELLVLQCRHSDCSREELHPNPVSSSEAHLVAFSAGADPGGKRPSILHLSCPSLELSLFPQIVRITVLWITRPGRTQMLSSPCAVLHRRHRRCSWLSTALLLSGLTTFTTQLWSLAGRG